MECKGQSSDVKEGMVKSSWQTSKPSQEEGMLESQTDSKLSTDAVAGSSRSVWKSGDWRRPSPKKIKEESQSEYYKKQKKSKNRKKSKKRKNSFKQKNKDKWSKSSRHLSESGCDGIDVNTTRARSTYRQYYDYDYDTSKYHKNTYKRRHSSTYIDQGKRDITITKQDPQASLYYKSNTREHSDKTYNRSICKYPVQNTSQSENAPDNPRARIVVDNASKNESNKTNNDPRPHDASKPATTQEVSVWRYQGRPRSPIVRISRGGPGYVPRPICFVSGGFCIPSSSVKDSRKSVSADQQHAHSNQIYQPSASIRQMFKRWGWNEGYGLGTNLQGVRIPLILSQRKGREGLGLKSEKVEKLDLDDNVVYT